ncbi:MAG: GFA family protein [Sphingopyxis sp.]|uniref:GFA family protein n=1 Tax=Sphingopyxis sp. TaxID=1908224 RepID=UPI002ABBE26B|nr:GFA family protein [Sphingopyxis sp.]MDZ3832724.1 GFA family protein [Sphingopyxis sp.]
MERIATEISGGCQCGAVRYHATAVLDTSHICHCRMCQKASGNFFAALIGVPRDALCWTRGAASTFNSSDKVERGFCRDCGTPLYYDYRESRHLSVTTGSLDEPARFPPKVQFGTEGRMSWFDTLPRLREEGTTEETMAEIVESIRTSNHQHPDHDTDAWPE